MQVGKYKIGRYHAIIKKMYADGSWEYETNFISENDLSQSAYAIKSCIGQLVGTATDNPRVLLDMQIIRGKAEIIKELEN